jgi:hypothetical protein
MTPGLETCVARSKALARGLRVGRTPRAPGSDHVDAIDGAGRKAELAAGAKRREHDVHALGSADDCIDGARIDAQRAPDAPGFVDPRHRERRRLTMGAVERDNWAAGQRRERSDERIAAGWAAVDCIAARNRVGVGTAGVVAAAPALRLRKDCIDAAREFHYGGHQSF